MEHEERRRRRSRLAAPATAAALAVTLAACSSTTSSGSGNQTEGVTSNSITLGTTQPLTGPAAPGYSEISPATKAYFDYVNAHGGVNGRKIDFLIEDDQYDQSKTPALTRKLVLQNHIFADVEPLGTPTVLSVDNFLNTEGVPTVFVASGCNCWSSASLPQTFGWQPPYTDEGKILGKYVTDHFAGQKVGYLSQDDEFGQDGVKGLDDEIAKSAVVSKQVYTGTSQGLANGLGAQMSALQSAGAKVVVLFTIPAATTLALLAAAQIGYHPQFVVSNVGSDAPTLTGLLTSISKGSAPPALLNGLISDAYMPPVTDASNGWVAGFKKILTQYDPGASWDGNTEYGLAVGYTFVQALQAAGKNLTRSSLVKAIEQKGSTFDGPGLVPLTYSSSVHYGYQGAEVVQLENGGQTTNVLEAPQQTTTSGSSPVTASSAPPGSPPAGLGS